MQSTGTCTGTWIFSTGTGTGTCNKVVVAKKKIFLCCWDAAGVATSHPKPKKYGCDWFLVFHHTLCSKFIGFNCSFFEYERYHKFYFVQLQCNWVLIIYAQYLYWYLKVRYWYLYWYLDHWYWYWYWYLFVEYLIQDCKCLQLIS